MVLRQPLGCRLGADFVDTGDVVAAVTDQRQIVDDLLGPDIKLGFDAGTVHARVAHGVDQLDVFTHQLRHIFIAGRDDDVFTGRGGARGQRADDIIGLDTDDAQQRQS